MQIISQQLTDPIIQPDLETRVLRNYETSIPKDPSTMIYFEEAPLEIRVREAAVADLRLLVAFIIYFSVSDNRVL